MQGAVRQSKGSKEASTAAVQGDKQSRHDSERV